MRSRNKNGRDPIAAALMILFVVMAFALAGMTIAAGRVLAMSGPFG